IQSATKTGGTVGTVIVKKIGGETPAGIQATFSDGAGSTGDASITANIGLLNTITTTVLTSTLSNKVIVAAYFLNADGSKVYCPQTVESGLTFVP
ncbi:MAG: hypothetical protein AAB866_00260, partial [Patescibacteria group bacterium]